jgi:enoyl-CoA hydratase/carnithine racemase
VSGVGTWEIVVAESAADAGARCALLSGVDDALCAGAAWDLTEMSDVERNAIVAMR